MTQGVSPEKGLARGSEVPPEDRTSPAATGPTLPARTAQLCHVRAVSPASAHSQFRLPSKDTDWQTDRASRILCSFPTSSPSGEGAGDLQGSILVLRPAEVGTERREARSQEGSPSVLPARPHRAGREKVRHRGGSRWVITCATPVTNSGTPSDVSIFSQRHRMVITSRDSLRSSRGQVGRGRGRKG